MLEDLLRDGFVRLGIEADETAITRFRTYYEYLEEKNSVMNLTAISGEKDVVQLHFLDCAELLTLADLAGKRVIDVGTGAGFPGMVLKILKPDMPIVLLDSLDKRINFLREVSDKLGFTGNDAPACIHARAEEAPKEYRAHFDIATSRAVARLNILAEMSLPFVNKGGLFIAMKGPGCNDEINEAKRAIKTLGGEVEKYIEYTIPGTDVTHSAVLIRKTADTPPKYPRRWAQIKKTPL